MTWVCWWWCHRTNSSWNGCVDVVVFHDQVCGWSLHGYCSCLSNGQTDSFQAARLLSGHHASTAQTPVIVVAVSVDNAAANRKFYIDHLCDGTLKTSIIDSTTGQPIFLLFDPIHTLKNVYNNFQRRETFECPPMFSQFQACDWTVKRRIYLES